MLGREKAIRLNAPFFPFYCACVCYLLGFSNMWGTVTLHLSTYQISIKNSHPGHHWKPELNDHLTTVSHRKPAVLEPGFYMLRRVLPYGILKLSFYLAWLLDFLWKHYAYLALDCTAILEISADAV